MKLIHLAVAVAFALIGLTAFVAWQAHIEARGARREVEMFRQQQNDQLAAGATAAPSILETFNPTPIATAPIPSSDTPRLPAPATSITPPAGDSPTVVLASPAATTISPAPTTDPDADSTLPARQLPAADTPAPLTPDQHHLLTLPAIARIKQSFADDGFVLVDAGTSKSLSAGMKFNVRRGSAVVGRLTLTDSIEVDEAIADIQPGSIPAGIELRVGDELVQIVTAP
jgi:cytoskeletal protein RodZ